MNCKNHIAAGMAAVFLASTLALPLAANAQGEEGKKNTTLGLGAAAAALLLTQKNKLPGVLAAGGAVYAGTQYNNAINARHKRERAAAARRSYRTGYRRGKRHTTASSR